ncbi:MAG: hypothetical protein JXR76_04850 [Deltaproteobacteria bacterium]|nr:hypothetical protein [Deltaproteobacteria bacterium]
MHISEYDAFGPWVYEIDDKHPVPKEFQAHINLSSKAKLMLKIPVNQERRKMRPDMVLYDQIVCAYDNHLDFYRYVNDEVVVIQVAYVVIEAIEMNTSLLQGTVRFHTEVGNFEFCYNTVSDDLIFKLINIIRDKIPTPIKKLPLAVRTTEDDLTFFTKGIWNRIKKQDNKINIIAYQPETKLRYAHRNIFVKAIGRIFATRLPDALFLYNFRDLVVISRAGKICYSQDNCYDYSFSFFPIERICSIERKSLGKYANITQLSIQTGHNSISFYIDKNNPDFQFIDHIPMQVIP